ncbi:hypothetical protein AB4Z54_01755, partial [Streptomyces sp. MCAF7]
MTAGLPCPGNSLACAVVLSLRSTKAIFPFAAGRMSKGTLSAVARSFTLPDRLMWTRRRPRAASVPSFTGTALVIS